MAALQLPATGMAPNRKRRLSVTMRNPIIKIITTKTHKTPSGDHPQAVTPANEFPSINRTIDLPSAEGTYTSKLTRKKL